MLSKVNWKLIAYRDDRYELFKVDEDIAEKNDLADNYPDKVQELKDLLKNWSQRTGINLNEYQATNNE